MKGRVIIMSTNTDAGKIITKIKALVKKGNINKIYVKKNDEVVMCFPVNVGIVGGLIGVAATPWTLVLAAVATIGSKCTVELQKDDGTIVDINNKTISDAGHKFIDISAVIVEDIEESIKTRKAERARKAEDEEAFEEEIEEIFEEDKDEE